MRSVSNLFYPAVAGQRFAGRPQQKPQGPVAEGEDSSQTKSDMPFFSRKQFSPPASANAEQKVKQLVQATVEDDTGRRISTAEQRIESLKKSLEEAENDLALAQQARDNPEQIMDKVYLANGPIQLTGKDLLELITNRSEKLYPNLTRGIGGDRIGLADFLCLGVWPLFKLADRSDNKRYRKYDPKAEKGIYGTQLNQELPEVLHQKLEQALKELKTCGFLESEIHIFPGTSNNLKRNRDTYWVLTPTGKKQLLKCQARELLK